MSLPRILVGVDFSPGSDRATEEARWLAQQMGAQLDFAHICPLPPSSPGLGPIDSSAHQIARKQLDTLELDSRAQGFVAKVHLGVGSPAVGLRDFIRLIEPILVVVGSHGHNSVLHRILGSVAESLIRTSPVPVLVVPAVERVAVDGKVANA